MSLGPLSSQELCVFSMRFWNFPIFWKNFYREKPLIEMIALEFASCWHCSNKLQENFFPEHVSCYGFINERNHLRQKITLFTRYFIYLSFYSNHRELEVGKRISTIPLRYAEANTFCSLNYTAIVAARSFACLFDGSFACTLVRLLALSRKGFCVPRSVMCV